MIINTQDLRIIQDKRNMLQSYYFFPTCMEKISRLHLCWGVWKKMFTTILMFKEENTSEKKYP